MIEGEDPMPPGAPWPNLTGNPNRAPRCGARTRAGCACRQPAMVNGRCRLHGGKSTGPRTAEGLERLRTARTKHGGYSAEAREFQKLVAKVKASIKPVTES